MKCWDNIKYKIIYFIYMILAVWFYIGQNSGNSSNGLKSFADFVGQILYQEPVLIRVMILPPLCILVLLHTQYYFSEQFVIRQKNRKWIYFKLLWTCLKDILLFSAIFVCISVCTGKIYGWHNEAEAGKEAIRLLVMTFLIFLCMMVLAISVVWIIQSKTAAVLLVCLFGFYDTVMCYSGLHLCSMACFMSFVFLTAEKREFYGEKYKNDSV